MHTPLFSSSDDANGFAATFLPGHCGQRIHFYETAQSTNDLALESARSGGWHGSVFIADTQLAGRGRRGRNWACAPGMGLLFSVLIRPANIPIECAGWIPLVAGMACAEALATKSSALGGVSVKWPNDLVLPCPAAPGWRKMGGILCESALPAMSGSTQSGARDRGYVVIGIGMNLNQTAEMLPETEKASPTSALIETGKFADRKAVLKDVLERLDTLLCQMEDEAERINIRDDIEGMMRAWMPASKRIVFRLPPFDLDPMIERSGMFVGLDSFGRIRILSDGVETAYADAEIVGVR